MSDLKDRKLFIVTFRVDEVLQNGQQPRVLHIPALVLDFNSAESAGLDFIADFKNKPEARQLPPDAKLEIQSIIAGGTILL
jgi:uncharacterized protein YccT (UPF0319 family)